MGPLLGSRILRNRSGRKHPRAARALAASLGLIFAGFWLGCDKAPLPERDPERERDRAARRPRPDRDAAPGESSERLQTEIERLQADAGLLEPGDPRPPSGELKKDLESFTTLDACVRSRATADPLLGDAIDALGYDTLTRDACRLLEAMKSKNTARCKPIAASALRARCETWVATLANDPTLCPLLEAGGRAPAREPVCLARASRDERLCAAAPAGEQASCRALVLADPTSCGRDESCVRQAMRWRSLVEKPHAHTPYPAHLHVQIHGHAGTAEPAVSSFDLDELAQGGVVIKKGGSGKIELSLGSPKNALWPDPQSPLAAPKLFIDLAVSTDDLAHGSTSIAFPAAKLEVLVPKTASLSNMTAGDVTVEGQIAVDAGGLVTLHLAASLRDPPRVFDVSIALETFVRDVVGR